MNGSSSVVVGVAGWFSLMRANSQSDENVPPTHRPARPLSRIPQPGRHVFTTIKVFRLFKGVFQTMLIPITCGIIISVTGNNVKTFNTLYTLIFYENVLSPDLR